MKCGNTPHRKVTDINNHILIQTTTPAKGDDIIADIFDSRQYKFQSVSPTTAMINSQSIANIQCYDSIRFAYISDERTARESSITVRHFNPHRLQKRRLISTPFRLI